MREYRIGRLGSRFVVTWIDEGGTRRRFRLEATNVKAAEAEARDVLIRQHRKSDGHTVADLWPHYITSREGRPIAETVGYTGKAILAHFGEMRPDQITAEDTKAYTATRRAAGRSVGTVWTELGHLASVLSWAAQARLIDRAPHIDRPAKPAPKERYMTDAEITRLLAVQMEPHIRLAILLMLTTAGRVGAVLDLTWDRVDLERGQINLRLDAEGPRKGRAIVPINQTLRAALVSAREAALSDHVVEWAGKGVASIRTGFNRAVREARLSGVTPHVLRHTAAVRMAGAGVPMSRISQFMGHSNTQVTERVYARFSADHLSDAAAALEIGALRVVK